MLKCAHLHEYNCLLFYNEAGKMYGAYFPANDKLELQAGVTAEEILREHWANHIAFVNSPDSASPEKLIGQLSDNVVKLMQKPPSQRRIA